MIMQCFIEMILVMLKFVMRTRFYFREVFLQLLMLAYPHVLNDGTKLKFFFGNIYWNSVIISSHDQFLVWFYVILNNIFRWSSLQPTSVKSVKEEVTMNKLFNHSAFSIS
jgi:hypothetical protein